MSQVSTSQELQAQSTGTIAGPLKHARTAALALALVPLAAVAVTTQIQEDQAAQHRLVSAEPCSMTRTATAFRIPVRAGISGVSVTVTYTLEGAPRRPRGSYPTDENGFYHYPD